MAPAMLMAALAVSFAVNVELLLHFVKHELHGVTFNLLTFAGAICFISAVANYINKPIIK